MVSSSVQILYNVYLQMLQKTNQNQTMTQE